MRCYVDSSALVKFVLAEKESDALITYLQSFDEMVSSRVAQIELTRAAARNAAAREDAIAETLDRLVFRELTSDIAAEAGRLRPAELRTLDAIHLATALELRGELEALVTYDARLARAASEHGLRVEAPA